MAKKPTSEELEQRVRELGKEVTELKLEKETLRQESDKLRSLMDGLSRAEIGIDIVGVDYTVLFQNQLLEERFDSLTGQLCHEKYMGLEEPCNFCPMIKAVRNNRTESVELTGNDGKNYEVLSTPLPNPDGTVDKAIEVIRDITDRKQAEEALLFKEAIIKSSSSVIATCDLEGNMTYGNPFFLKTWGFDDPEEFLGRPFWNFWLVEDRLEEIMQTLRVEGTWSDEIQAVRKDGTLSDVHITAATVFDSKGNPIALTSTSIDITDRKQAKKRLHESEEKFHIIYNTSSAFLFQSVT